MLRRGLGMLGVMLLLGAAGAVPAAASSGYTFTNLLTCCTAVGGGAAFDSNAVIADGVNNLGDIALTGYGTDGHEHAFIWKNNQFTTCDRDVALAQAALTAFRFAPPTPGRRAQAASSSPARRATPPRCRGTRP
jgi:hypothetical protein